MPIERDLPKYFQSYSNELDAVKNRVRNIIGHKHWVSDGTHKEVILQDVLRRFIPDNFEVSSGFIINDDGSDSSKQIDILIYDRSSPIFFKSTNFVIIPRQYVKALIEVKTGISSEMKMKNALENLYTAQKIINSYSDNVYVGLFSYGYEGFTNTGINRVSDIIWDRISSFYKEKSQIDQISLVDMTRKFMLTTVCINKLLYALNWNQNNVTDSKFRFYDTKNQSFNYFISNLLSTLDANAVNSTKALWYPVSKTSSQVLERTLSIETE